MTTLAVDRLISYLEQPITVRRDLLCASLRAKLYVHALPSGTFTLKISRDSQIVSQVSFSSVNLQQKISTPYVYFWGDFAFPATFHLTRGDYLIRLESSGYTFTDSSFIGWVKDFDELERDLTGEANDFSQYPFSFNLIEYKQREVIP